MSAAPIVKSAGGKTKLLPELMSRMPRRFENYFEPFVGGGALFFALAPKRAVIGDANPDLVTMYRAIRDDVEDVISLLEHLQADHSEDRYYDTREAWNARDDDDAHARAATFIYLNKTCFNGLWRVNSMGRFNAPIGDSPRPAICRPDELRAAAAALAGIQVCMGDFRNTIAAAKPGDFVYADPPYDGTYGAYTTAGFTDEDQAELAHTVRTLAKRGVACMVSNSDTPRIRALYAGMQIDVVRAARSINSDGKRRGKVGEVIVTTGYERTK